MARYRLDKEPRSGRAGRDQGYRGVGGESTDSRYGCIMLAIRRAPRNAAEYQDAELARAHGADGIVLSNHGGRALD